MSFFNILFDSSRRVYIKMSLDDFLHGKYFIGLEKRNPFLTSIDSLLTEKEADKKIKILNQTDI
ncbi:hypothetical protein D3C87_546660 [compost metagenome]